ncbi:MAG: acyl-CoA dehydrogenase family protein, partial [Ilumatobacter fluminis]
MSTTATSDIDIDAAGIDAWLDANWDPDLTVRAWWARLAADGLANPVLPPPFGRGWPRSRANALARAMMTRGALGPPAGLGMMLAAPTLLAHGSPELVERFVPRILDGEHGWCQLFSEPGAGSDLAGLQTRAERDGDEWVITGQKVWTSLGQWADYGILIARTAPDLPKHRGLSYFVFPMRQDGVEVRPLREMTGRALFNEVFIDEARVPPRPLGRRAQRRLAASEHDADGRAQQHRRRVGDGAERCDPRHDLGPPRPPRRVVRER